MALTKKSKSVIISIHIIETKGNINTKFFEEKKLPFKLYLNLSRLKPSTLISRAEKVINKLKKQD